MNNTIYIYCPAASYTGGPTLAHQLCRCLRDNGVDALMWYDCNPIKRFYVNPVHNRYKVYNNPYVKYPPKDLPSVSIIALESNVSILCNYNKAKRYVWWMSVDNYYLNMCSAWDSFKNRLGKYHPSIEHGKDLENRKEYSVIKEDDVTHLVQSEYARLFLKSKQVQESKIYDLGDYLEDEVFTNVKNHRDTNRSSNIVLYNPKKGIEFTNRLIKAAPEIEWIPLLNMTKKQVTQFLLSSKLYIDFGNHPGKDRFPREAVTCGCCIITGKRGAAANDIDIPIPEKYKFDESNTSVEKILGQIKMILNEYDKCIADFEKYKVSIAREKEEFERQALVIFK